MKLVAGKGYSLSGLTSDGIRVTTKDGSVLEASYEEETKTVSVTFDALEAEEAAFAESTTVDGVTITVTAPEGVLPKGAVLKVEPITDKE